MKFLSLFSGIGGLDLGLERAGMTCIAQVEIDPYRRAVLEKHWPGVPRFNDVHKFCRRIGDCLPENGDGEVIYPRCETEFGECECVGTDQFTDEHGFPDLIAGGDPCQENANCRRSADALQPSLGGEFIRVVEQLMPQLVLRENPSAVRADAPWPFWRFRAELEGLGYTAIAFRVRACCCGADFRRDRLFLLAEIPQPEQTGLEGHERPVVARADQGRQDADAARPDRWSATPRICRGADGISNKMDRIAALGDSVVPKVAEWIGRRIMEVSAA